MELKDTVKGMPKVYYFNSNESKACFDHMDRNLGNLDLGNAGVMLVPIAAVVINTVVKWAKNNTSE